MREPAEHRGRHQKAAGRYGLWQRTAPRAVWATGVRRLKLTHVRCGVASGMSLVGLHGFYNFISRVSSPVAVPSSVLPTVFPFIQIHIHSNAQDNLGRYSVRCNLVFTMYLLQ